MNITHSLSKQVGVQNACKALAVPRSSFYRWRKPVRKKSRNLSPPLALSKQEEQTVFDILHEQRFVDRAPRSIFTALLDEGSATQIKIRKNFLNALCSKTICHNPNRGRLISNYTVGR